MCQRKEPRMRRFEFDSGASSKFWEISVDAASFTVRWGRKGTAGQSRTKTLDDETQARREAEKLIAEKLGKGYVEIGGGDWTALLQRVQDDAESSPHGTASTDAALDGVEKSIGARLPAAYRAFMRRFGGGEFRFGRFQHIPDLPFRNDGSFQDVCQTASEHDPRVGPRKLIPFADDYSGEYYYFDFRDGRAAIHFWPTWQNEPEETWDSFLAFVEDGLT